MQAHNTWRKRITIKVHKTQKASKTQKCLRIYRQQRSQRALHAGMEMFSWGGERGRVRCEGVKARERDSQKKKRERFYKHRLRGIASVFCASWIKNLDIRLSRPLALFATSGSRLTLKPQRPPDAVSQTEHVPLDVSIKKTQTKHRGGISGEH